MSKKVNLLNLSKQELADFFVSIGEKPFRSQQIMKWIHQFLVDDFDEMSNVSKKLREKLKEIAEIKAPEVVHEQISADGTIKWALKLESGQAIETVYIPERERGTLCVSSQIGCALECSFCSTAQQGFNRNLSVAEIVGQLWIAAKRLGALKTTGQRKVTNVVMMGMGEPLLNFDAVVKAMNLMMDDLAYGLSKRRVTLSTSGVLPALDRLLEHTDVALAISLHATTDEVRDILVPINKKYPIAELMKSINKYLDGSAAARKATIEYVMLDGINDSAEDAKRLVKLLSKTPSKINLIPFNTFPGTNYLCSSNATIDRFSNILQNAGFTVVVRRTRGDDIDAACGQLAGKVNDKTKRSQRRQQVIEVQTIN